MNKENHINIINKADCTGCRACEQLCPVKCIKMVEDNEGFIFPKIDEEKCINCGLCKKRCPQLKNITEKKQQKVYAVKAKKVADSKQSTSAGMAYIISKYVINNKGVVFGSSYDENLRPNQIKNNNIEELTRIRGSKYIFSNTLNTYTEAKKELDNNKLVLYTGTPCQIAGLYAYLGKEYSNLITADIVCHGVPSQKCFLKYLSYIEEKYGKKVTNYEFRNKDKAKWGGIGDRSLKITFEDNSIKYLLPNFDPYYFNFLKGNTYRECCYQCKYANTQRIGDITLADFWGIEFINYDFYSKEGVSLVIVNTKKGKEIFEHVKDMIDYNEQTKEEGVKQNGNLVHPTKRNIIRNDIYKGIDEISPKEFVRNNLKVNEKTKNAIKHILPNNIKYQVKKIVKR